MHSNIGTTLYSKINRATGKYCCPTSFHLSEFQPKTPKTGSTNLYSITSSTTRQYCSKASLCFVTISDFSIQWLLPPAYYNKLKSDLPKNRNFAYLFHVLLLNVAKYTTFLMTKIRHSAAKQKIISSSEIKCSDGSIDCSLLNLTFVTGGAEIKIAMILIKQLNSF